MLEKKKVFWKLELKTWWQRKLIWVKVHHAAISFSPLLETVGIPKWRCWENIYMWHLLIVSALGYLAVWYFQMAIDSFGKCLWCDSVCTSCFRGLQILWHPGYLVPAVVQNCNALLLALELRLCLTFQLVRMKQELARFPASHSSLCSSSFICGLGEETKINHFINIQV